MANDPSNTAPVLIEYQNDVTSGGGALRGAVEEVMDEIHMLAKTVQVVDEARAAGVAVMHAPITFKPGYTEISDHPYGILKAVVDGNAFVKGEWGAEFVDDLEPREGDIVVEGKRGLATFASTNLGFMLRSKGIQTIVLGGFLANCRIESTMRSGYENGYEFYTLTDRTAATSPEEHKNAIAYDYPMFAMPFSAEELLQELG